MKKKSVLIKSVLAVILVFIVGSIYIAGIGFKFVQSIEKKQIENLNEWSKGDAKKKKIVAYYFFMCRTNIKEENKKLSIYQCAKKYTNKELEYILRKSAESTEATGLIKFIL